MRLNLSADLSKLFDLIRSYVKPSQEIYIVGGAIRDVLLGRELNDLDFVLSENPTLLAKQIARELGVGFFVLDDERNTARVVYHREGKRAFPLDFVQFTGQDLLTDLEHRDFTINAIAIQMNNLERLIDPLGGIRDLAEGIIRTCSKQSLLDDPVRVLRGIRLAAQYDFSYAAGVPELMKEASKNLPKTSFERQRDEFFKILEGPNPAEGMKQSRKFGVFTTLIPPLIAQEDVPASPPHTLPLFDHTISVISYLDSLLKDFSIYPKMKKNLPWWQLHFMSKLNKYSEPLKGYLDEEITLGRSKLGLLFFSALVHDIGKPSTLTLGEDGYLHFYNHAEIGAAIAWEAAKRLRMSNSESEWIRKVVRYHMSLLPFFRNGRKPTRMEIHHFFKEAGEAGLAVVLLSLADSLGTYNQHISQNTWDRQLAVCEALLSAWYEEQDSIVSPKLILDGNDLKKLLGVQPGKAIGQLLEKLEEAQAAGQVHTKDEAILFLQEKLKGYGDDCKD